MRFDTLLTRDDGPALAEQIAAMRDELRLGARGVTQRRDQLRQFELEIDERDQWWSLKFDDGTGSSYRDGQLSVGVDLARVAPFAESAVGPIRMLWPEKLPQWG